VLPCDSPLQPEAKAGNRKGDGKHGDHVESGERQTADGIRQGATALVAPAPGRILDLDDGRVVLVAGRARRTVDLLGSGHGGHPDAERDDCDQSDKTRSNPVIGAAHVSSSP
jgi:hypothetical protein